MKFFSLLTALLISTTALAADPYRMVVPDKPGSGASVWATAVVKQLNKHTDRPIVLEHIPGNRNTPGVNKFHNKLRFDNDYLLMTIGSNASNVLVEKVDYDYSMYDAIGAENLDIIVGRSKNYNFESTLVWGNSAGLVDTLGMALYICGNLKTTKQYIDCWNSKAKWVNGVGSGEQKLYVMRGEYNVFRDSPAAWSKHWATNDATTLWYTNGIYSVEKKTNVPNPNFDSSFFFPEVFKQKWGVYPTGEFYESYRALVITNNALQRVLWVNKGNPNREKLVTALTKMLNDPEAMAELKKDLGGVYKWNIGNDINNIVKTVYGGVKTSNKKQIAAWYKDALGQNSEAQQVK
jgi:hypothetical protein